MAYILEDNVIINKEEVTPEELVNKLNSKLAKKQIVLAKINADQELVTNLDSEIVTIQGILDSLGVEY